MNKQEWKKAYRHYRSARKGWEYADYRRGPQPVFAWIDNGESHGWVRRLQMIRRNRMGRIKLMKARHAAGYNRPKADPRIGAMVDRVMASLGEVHEKPKLATIRQIINEPIYF